MTSFGKMTSGRFNAMERSAQIRYCHEVAEMYRDEVVLPQGGCGFIWRVSEPAVGSVACEKQRGHSGPHSNGSLRCVEAP